MNIAQEWELCVPMVELNEGDMKKLVPELVKPKTLLHANHGTRILPGTNTFLLQVNELILPN